MAETIFNKESIQYGEIVTLETVSCYKCGVPFAMPARLKRHFLDSQECFYCPNGHSQAYVTSTESKLKKRIEDLEFQKANLHNVISNKNETISALGRQKSAIKGQMTKIKNRIKNGVCPCCNRTFKNLSNHMKDMHPDFVPPTNSNH